MLFSGRDLYPNMGTVTSTSDLSAPELGEQLVLTQGNDSNYSEVMTKADQSNILWAILAVVGMLFLFGVL